MGLDCSHDAFHGAYSAFSRLRQCVAAASGGSYPPHYVYGPNGQVQEDERGRLKRVEGLDDGMVYFGRDLDETSGLRIFLEHSDCDGEIGPDDCLRVADELEPLLPRVEAMGWLDCGHIGRDGGYVAVLKRFIAGCRAAHAAGEPLLFR